MKAMINQQHRLSSCKKTEHIDTDEENKNQSKYNLKNAILWMQTF